MKIAKCYLYLVSIIYFLIGVFTIKGAFEYPLEGIGVTESDFLIAIFGTFPAVIPWEVATMFRTPGSMGFIIILGLITITLSIFAVVALRKMERDSKWLRFWYVLIGLGIIILLLNAYYGIRIFPTLSVIIHDTVKLGLIFFALWVTRRELVQKRMTV